MSKDHILVVEDEEEIRELVRYNLAKAGYHVSCVGSGEEALHAIRGDRPNLLVLDLMLPGVQGLEICRILKKDPQTEDVHIVILTAMGEESDVVAGLELGADDYVTKPFSPRVLLARIKAVLRRTPGDVMAEDTPVRIHGLTVDPGRFSVEYNGSQIQLTRTEFRVLHALVMRPGWVFTRYQIVDAVHGSDYPVTDRSVDVQIAGLRKKLGAAGKYIETVRGVGYRFRE